MQIQGPTHLHGPQAINAPHGTKATQPTPQPEAFRETDQLDISPEADLASRIREVPEIRAERVASIRAAIESGEYETEEKLEMALYRLLDEMG